MHLLNLIRWLIWGDGEMHLVDDLRLQDIQIEMNISSNNELLNKADSLHRGGPNAPER